MRQIEKKKTKKSSKGVNFEETTMSRGVKGTQKGLQNLPEHLT